MPADVVLGMDETTVHEFSISPEVLAKKIRRYIPMWDYLYLGSCQMYRESAVDGGTTTLERETLEFMPDGKRVSLFKAGREVPCLTLLFRYEIESLICSAALKLDDQVQIISDEK
jgi:hypothetical protein